jgi:hypothetical protein
MTGAMTTDEAKGALACPKDGRTMEPVGRRGRGGAYRCPACKGVFLDTEAMRRGRGGSPPAWARVAMSVLLSVLMSVGMTLLVRRLRQRREP